MKHRLCLTALLLCLSLCACAGPTADPQPSTTNPPASQLPTNSGRPVTPRPTLPTPSGEAVEFRNASAVKVNYSVDVSSVRYITSADQLPNYEALKKYDDKYFETGALVVILDSVRSGGIQTGVESITYDRGENSVVLGREVNSSVTVPVKTTWLIWAEVDRELPGTWKIVNPSSSAESVTQ